MDALPLTMVQQIAQVGSAFEQTRTGRAPQSVAVVHSDRTLVITLEGTLSPAEKALAQTPAGVAQVQEYHRQLFATAAGPLLQEITRTTGVAVREAAAEVALDTGVAVAVFASGTVVHVFLLTHGIPPAEILDPAV